MNESKIEYTANGVNVVDRDNIRDKETTEKVPINTPQISEESPIKINKQRFKSQSHLVVSIVALSHACALGIFA